MHSLVGFGTMIGILKGFWIPSFGQESIGLMALANLRATNMMHVPLIKNNKILFRIKKKKKNHWVADHPILVIEVA
jgi:hypothetical protein